MSTKTTGKKKKEKTMKVGDLVENLNSKSGITGIIVGWHEFHGDSNPVVQWADGRCSWIVRRNARVIA